MTRVSNNVGERVNKFDNLLTQNVGSFNLMFPECPITSFDNEAEVEILSPGANNTRYLLIGGIEVRHKMFSDLLYNLDRDVYNNKEEDESDNVLGQPCE